MSGISPVGGPDHQHPSEKMTKAQFQQFIAYMVLVRFFTQLQHTTGSGGDDDSELDRKVKDITSQLKNHHISFEQAMIEIMQAVQEYEKAHQAKMPLYKEFTAGSKQDLLHHANAIKEVIDRDPDMKYSPLADRLDHTIQELQNPSSDIHTCREDLVGILNDFS